MKETLEITNLDSPSAVRFSPVAGSWLFESVIIQDDLFEAIVSVPLPGVGYLKGPAIFSGQDPRQNVSVPLPGVGYLKEQIKENMWLLAEVCFSPVAGSWLFERFRQC